MPNSKRLIREGEIAFIENNFGSALKFFQEAESYWPNHPDIKYYKKQISSHQIPLQTTRAVPAQKPKAKQTSCNRQTKFSKSIIIPGIFILLAIVIIFIGYQIYDKDSQAEPFIHIPQKNTVVFQDDFITNENLWDQGNFKGFSYHIDSGEYIITHSTVEQVVLNLKEIKDFHSRNYIIEANIRQIYSLDAGGYGIAWTEKGSEEVYSLAVSKYGYSWHGKVNNSGWDRSAEQSVKKVNMNPKSTNKLTVQKSGDHMLFFLNDYLVGDMKYKKGVLSKAGFVVKGKQQVHVDHISVKEF